MQVAFWVVAGLLAFFYAFAGTKKLVQSQETLAPMMAWAGTTVPMGGVRLIGLAEVAGAVGLVLPPLTGVLPVLAVAAAIALALLQVLAGAFHLARRETQDVWLNGVLVALAAVAAWLATTWV